MAAATTRPAGLRTAALTAAALVAFAANSVLCRLALAQGGIDAASFSSIRVVSGALALAAIWLATAKDRATSRWSLNGALALFAYLVGFSFAYRSLGAATGALILFGSVQLTMLAAALMKGERFTPLAVAGLIAAIGGLVYLVSPGLRAPDPTGAALMACAGVAWGFYSLIGRGVADPLGATARNFILAALPTLLVNLVMIPAGLEATREGVLLAVASGILASGLGYVIWFAALRGLTAGTAATVQLAVPVIAAFGAVLLLSEPVTLRLVAASAATLGGVGLVLIQRR